MTAPSPSHPQHLKEAAVSESVMLLQAATVLMDGDAHTNVHETAAYAVWHAMSSAHRDVLRQLLSKPTEDGDIASKQARDDLIELGLATRCCFNGEQGFTVATYPAATVMRMSLRTPGPRK